MAAKPIDRVADYSRLVKLGRHATKLVQQFVGLDHADYSRRAELLAELERVISEFRRLRPPPLFRKEVPPLRVVRACYICRSEITPERESFETIGAVYHVDCYERETGKSRSGS